jgi:hypothetical protein
LVVGNEWNGTMMLSGKGGGEGEWNGLHGHFWERREWMGHGFGGKD